MTLDDLRRAIGDDSPNGRDNLLNLSALSREAGLSQSYLRSYLASGRELPDDVQKRVDEALRRRGLLGGSSAR